MQCKYCGAELQEGAAFCHKCGKICSVEAPQDGGVASEEIFVQEQMAYTPDEQVDPFEQEKSDLGGNTLFFAIMGLAFSMTVWFSWLGLVFSLVARARVKEYISKFGYTEGRATVGKHLSIAGVASSIAFMVIGLFSTIIGVILGMYA